MKPLTANQLAVLHKIAAAPTGLPSADVHWQVRRVLADRGLIAVSEKKGETLLKVTAEGRKTLKKSSKVTA